MSSRSLFYRPRLECLEARETPAGNVVASFINGSLTLAGTYPVPNTLVNAIVITQNANNTLTITGTNNTLINGQASFTTPLAVTGSLNVYLGQGRDSITFDLTNQDITVGGNLVINSPDADVIKTVGAANGHFLSVGTAGVANTGDASITQGVGAADTEIANVKTTGSLLIVNNNSATNAGNFTDVFTGAATLYNQIGKDLAIRNGSGGATNFVFNSNVGTGAVGGNLLIANGDPVATAGGFTNWVDAAAGAPNLPTVNGNLSITNNGGTILNLIGSVAVAQNVGVQNGKAFTSYSGGVPTATFQTAAQASSRTIIDQTGATGQPAIGGSLTVQSNGGSFVQIGAGVTGLGAVIGGNVTITGLTLLPTGFPNSPNVQFNNAVVVGTTSINLGGNTANRMDVTNSNFFGLFGYKAPGAGAAKINLQTIAGTTTFNERVKISLGSGNDTVNIAHDGTNSVNGAVVNFVSMVTYPDQFILGNAGTNKKNVGAGAMLPGNTNFFFNFV